MQLNFIFIRVVSGNFVNCKHQNFNILGLASDILIGRSNNLCESRLHFEKHKYMRNCSFVHAWQRFPSNFIHYSHTVAECLYLHIESHLA